MRQPTLQVAPLLVLHEVGIVVIHVAAEAHWRRPGAVQGPSAVHNHGAHGSGDAHRAHGLHSSRG